MKNQIVKFWRDEEGATAIEYAVIAGVMAVGVVTAMGALTGGLKEFFDGIADFLKAKTPKAT